MKSQRAVPAALLPLLLAVFVGTPTPVSAAGDPQRPHAQEDEPGPVKPALGDGKNTSPSHVAQEGGSRRPLWLDSSRVAEFRKGEAGAPPSIRAATSGEATRGSKDSSRGAATSSADSTAELSPVFVDASGQPRALPGGIIVSLKQQLSDSQAQAQLQAQGLTPVRRIGARMWLIESPVGMASLEQANRLQASGHFEFVQPNWWQPRTTK